VAPVNPDEASIAPVPNAMTSLRVYSKGVVDESGEPLEISEALTETLREAGFQLVQLGERVDLVASVTFHTPSNDGMEGVRPSFAWAARPARRSSACRRLRRPTPTSTTPRGGARAKRRSRAGAFCKTGMRPKSWGPGSRLSSRITDAVPSAQLALFTASQGDEISGPAQDENAGLFTKFVAEGLGTGQADADGDGQITLQELSDWVSPRVAREAKGSQRDQHPKLIVGNGIGAASNFVVEYGLAK
jgi:hypothetical protein